MFTKEQLAAGQDTIIKKVDNLNCKPWDLLPQQFGKEGEKNPDMDKSRFNITNAIITKSGLYIFSDYNLYYTPKNAQGSFTSANTKVIQYVQWRDFFVTNDMKHAYNVCTEWSKFGLNYVNMDKVLEECLDVEESIKHRAINLQWTQVGVQSFMDYGIA